MKFSLINILMVILLVAHGLGLVLSDTGRIKQHALQLEKDRQFIRESESWRLGNLDNDPTKPLNREMLYYFDQRSQAAY